MHLPESEIIESELDAIGLLPVLYCHGCCDDTHEFHKTLAVTFDEYGLLLQRDPFVSGVDVQVAMRRLLIHGVIFHADAKSIASSACAVELKAAKEIGAPVLTLCDGVSTPTEERNRISITLPARATITPASAKSLAKELRERARGHWVCAWLAETGRTVEEREAGAAWLCKQSAQVLAEFFHAIVHLHRNADEDPSVSARLASVLERTNLRKEARIHLLRWHEEAAHPLSRLAIEDILSEWGWKIGASAKNSSTPSRKSHNGRFLIVVFFISMSATGIAVAIRGLRIEVPASGGVTIILGHELMKASETITRSINNTLPEEAF